ncbi:thiamine pyrophosphate-binding protein [Acetomicrobium sp.]|uniref:thiamine pyrophosphate-binding protein n=1 Tax=Acetomicrobium sp. TaxID=1872099 RepID=UPI001BCCD98E|nr:thiamine pyrophosphate-binding protein [Acetomicrobium sp.]
MTKTTGGKVVIKTLEALGVEVVFGIPGVHNLEIYKALLDSPIRHITTRHEQGAAFAADGYSRIKGKPGVAITITGPGLTNAVTALAGAYHDSVPLLLISSQIPRESLTYRSGFLHEVKDSRGMASSVCKESISVMYPEDISSSLIYAWELSQKGRPGPVHVEIPTDLLSEGFFGEPQYLRDCRLEDLGSILRPVDEDIDKAVSFIDKAHSCAIIAGGGALAAGKEITKLAEKIAAPIVTTCAGKGVVDERHALSLGARLNFKVVKDYLEDLDLLLIAGSELSPTDFYQYPLKPKGVVIQVDLDPGNFARQSLPDIPVMADCKAAITILADRVSTKGASVIEEVSSKVKSIKAAARDELSSSGELGEETYDAVQAINSIRKALPDEGMIFADMTIPAYVAISEFPSYGPRTFLHPVGFGTLGWALPAALGAKAACSHAPIIVLAGDGGFQFTMEELALTVEENLPLVIVIWHNNGFGILKNIEKRHHFRKPYAVDQSLPNFSLLASAYGIRSFRVTSAAELEEALGVSLCDQTSAIIEYKSGRT